MIIPKSAQHLIGLFPLGFVATVDDKGYPAVSPKGTFLVVDDETIAFGEIRSPGTLSNLERLAMTEVNFIDQWKRKGVRIAGPTRIAARGGEEFDALIGRWEKAWGDLSKRINALVIISAQTVKAVSTPPYDNGATEEEMIALYKQKFSEIYP